MRSHGISSERKSKNTCFYKGGTRKLLADFVGVTTQEEGGLGQHSFSRKLANHLSIGTGVARNVTNNLIAEYKVEFCKYKQNSSRSARFTGKKHSAETRAKIAKSTIERNKARAINCAEQGINYRHYKQDADKQIEVANFCNNTRINSISSDKIII